MSKLTDSNRRCVEEITELLAAKVPSWFGAGVRLHDGSVSFRQYLNSFILRYRLDGAETNPIGILVKIPRKPANWEIVDAIKSEYLRRDTRQYFQAMQAIWETFEKEADARCVAIRPLEYFEKWNAIAMLEVEGRQLKDLALSAQFVFSLRGARKTFLQNLGKAARWLRIYHDRLGQVRIENFSFQDAAASLEPLLSVSGRPLGIPGGARISLLQTFQHARQLAVARAHDDYHYSNVIITTDGRACGFDARRKSMRNPIYEDIGILIEDPSTRLIAILTGGLLLSQSFLAESRATIVVGYFGERKLDEIEEDVLDFFCVLAILDKWQINEKRLASGIGRLIAPLLLPWERRYFNGLIKRILYRRGIQVSREVRSAHEA